MDSTGKSPGVAAAAVIALGQRDFVLRRPHWNHRLTTILVLTSLKVGTLG